MLRKLPALALITCLLAIVSAASAPSSGKWVQARSPNFIVVSNAGEGQARKIAVQFEQIRSLFRDSLPYAKDQMSSPVITILAVKDEDSLRELLPEYWEQKGRAHPGGMFITRGDQLQIAVNLAAHGDNAFEAVYHEYYHSVTVPYFPGMPTWLAEGLAEFYGNSVIHDKTANLGMPNSDLIETLRAQPLIPLSVLLKADHNSPYYNEQNKVSVFYAESWALTHYLMLGDNRAHEPTFGAYLSALSHGATQDEAAAKAFGDLRKLQDDLRTYIGRFIFSMVVVPAPAKLPESDLNTLSLSEAQVDAYVGGFLALHNQFQQAEPLLKQSAELDPQLALAQRNLALLHFFRDERADALTCLSAAIALDSQDATTRYLRARLTFEGGSHSDPQVEEDLRQALASDPNSAPANGLLAAYLAANNQKLPEALTFATKAVSLEPGYAGYQVALAQVLVRIHRFDDAEVLARRIRASAVDDAGRAQADKLLNYVNQSRNYDARMRAMQEATAARDAAAAAAHDTEAAPAPDSPPEGEPPILKRRGDSPGELTGVVTLVRCVGDEMDITLKTDALPAPVVLRAKDRNHIDYASNITSIRGDIEPCSELKGHTITAAFHPPAAKAFFGEIDRIVVTK